MDLKLEVIRQILSLFNAFKGGMRCISNAMAVFGNRQVTTKVGE